jgi:hypothetical protein
MTALTDNRYTKHRDGIVVAHGLKAGAHIFKGALVALDSTGYAVPASDTAGLVVMGIALEEADNSAGSDGDVIVRVQARGVFSLALGGTLDRTSIGRSVYVADDQTVAAVADVTNDIPAGRLEALDGAAACWVRLP